MNIQTRLCSFETADKEILHGLLFTPLNKSSDLALLMIHGVAMNFYMTPLAKIGQILAERGYHCFVINTRGHDWISRAGDLTAFGGAAYENLEDCLKDLDSALDYLLKQTYRRFVLVGHSLGCVKSLLYQGARQRADVVGVVSCSCPKQYYSARAIEQPHFKELMAKAEQLVAEGKGEELFWALTGGVTGLFSARTFVSKYGPHEKNDVRPHAARLGCPFLAIAGGAEHAFFREYAKELADAAGPKLATCKIVAGANHSYHNYESEVIEIIAEWLRRFKN
jgi:alpha-beta hydrolase superfamily lysophospholipase